MPGANAAQKLCDGGAGGYAPRCPAETVLYKTVRASLESFLAWAATRDRNVPTFVEQELRDFLACGVLAHGFVRVHCAGCGYDRVVPLSWPAGGIGVRGAG